MRTLLLLLLLLLLNLNPNTIFVVKERSARVKHDHKVAVAFIKTFPVFLVQNFWLNQPGWLIEKFLLVLKEAIVAIRVALVNDFTLEHNLVAHFVIEELVVAGVDR